MGVFSTSFSKAKKLQNSQNAWQSAENEKDRVFQADQWMSQFAAENEEYRARDKMANAEWERRFNMENEYNDPSALMRRLSQAGINPAAALGQLTGTGGLASAGGSSSPQFSSPVSPTGIGSHSVSSSIPGFGSNFSDIGGSIASMMQALSSMKQANVSEGRLDLDTERQNKMIEAEYNNLVQDTRNKQAESILLKIRADIDGTLGKSEKAASIYRNLTEARLAIEKGNTEEYERKFKAAQTALLETKDNAIQQAMPQIMQNMSALHDVYEADIKQKNAAAIEHYAGANLKNEEAATVSGLREGQITELDRKNAILNIQKALGDIEVQQAIATNPAKIDALLAEYETAGVLEKQEKERLAMLIKDRKWQEAEKWLNSIESGTRSLKNVTGSLSDIKSFLQSKPNKIGF